MHHHHRVAAAIGLPFYWLILASLWLAVMPAVYLVKGLVLGTVALVQLVARLHREDQATRRSTR